LIDRSIDLLLNIFLLVVSSVNFLFYFLGGTAAAAYRRSGLATLPSVGAVP